ncbi:type II toxin-antitoxin system PemK/MazF family toxin [Isoptericola sp. 178]|uniref:type II toxin-antitoxin system PemK/MazF family toxin n=1 Tax=Isoptericola sp. 178 TaxID=3064651 RepID=UPI002714295C|nr:type II toxin-antitoxin system PemK/MazF family toxin [Isoptericola sp. 178]MDO8143490.1 type II toxin-antitoxin system PemK/MazF family toxin [Isoptericola sp. 178]
MIRGAVYPVDLGEARGHEQGGKRYGIVVSPSSAPWTVATVVPTSTSARALSFRPELEVAGKLTRVLVDQVRTVDVVYLGDDPVDYLAHDDMVLVEEALARYLGLVPAPWEGA